MELTWKTADKLSVRVLEEDWRCETRQTNREEKITTVIGEGS